MNRKTKYGWMGLGGLLCLLSIAVAAKMRDGNRAVAQSETSGPTLEIDGPHRKDDKAPLRKEEKGKAAPAETSPPPLALPLAPLGSKLPDLKSINEPNSIVPAAHAPTPMPLSDGGDVRPILIPASGSGSGPAAPPDMLPLPKSASDKAVPALTPAPVLPVPAAPPLSAPLASTPPGILPEIKAPLPPSAPPSDPTPPAPTLPIAPPNLTVPPPAPSVQVPPVPVPPASGVTQASLSVPMASNPGKSYRVRGASETVKSIARMALGSSERWVEVQKLNPALRPDATLTVGMEVRLPADAVVVDELEPIKPLPAVRTKLPSVRPKTLLPLTGTFQVTLDDARTFVLPQAIRDQLGGCETVLVSPGTDKCLWLTNQAHLTRLGQRLEQSPAREADVRNFKRLYYAQAVRTPIKAEDRVTIGERMAAFAGLEREVVLVGIDDHFEVWDLARWRRYTQQRTHVNERN